MREIKFRAWDKELKTMVYSKELTGYVDYNTNPVDAINIILNEDDCGLEFMQYTGIRDSKRTDKYPKGQESYEGDLIKTGKVYGYVGYKNGAFWCFYNNGNDEDLLCDIVFHIIGNKYENPELAK